MNSAFIVIGLLLTFFVVFETIELFLGKNYEESLLIFEAILTSCAMLLLLNDVNVEKSKWAMIASIFVISAAVVMFLSLIVAVIVQCCKSRFKARWDADGLILLSSVILGMTGYACMI